MSRVNRGFVRVVIQGGDPEQWKLSHVEKVEGAEKGLYKAKVFLQLVYEKGSTAKRQGDGGRTEVSDIHLQEKQIIDQIFEDKEQSLVCRVPN